MKYAKRLLDQELQDRLTYSGAVVIEGPKACGKTETARRQAKSEVLLDVDTAAHDAADIDPSLPLKGARPRLLDEWQVVPSLWNAVRRDVDTQQLPGQFVLTGSASPVDDITRHTGAGRMSRLRMRTMTLQEIGCSAKSASLKAILEGTFESCDAPAFPFDDLIECVCRGGWPGTMRHSLQNAQQFIIDYLDEVCHTGISNGLGVKHDPARLRLLLCSIARNTATEASLEMLRKDVLNQLTHKGNALEATETVARYLDSLERLMIYEPLPSWMPHLRSSARLRKKPTLHFVDPALAVGALRATPDDLKSDLKYLGFLFESLVIRDLRVYAQPLRGDVSHYRDSYGLEVDAIVEIDATKWCAIEIKLSSRSEVIDAAARNLLRFAAQLDYTNREKPRELVVITGSGYGYRRKDGVIVMPFGALYA